MERTGVSTVEHARSLCTFSQGHTAWEKRDIIRKADSSMHCSSAEVLGK